MNLAFNELKRALSSTPVLSISNQKSETELHTDARIHGYGCILFQKSLTDKYLHPVYYLSKKTTVTKKSTVAMNLRS